MNAQYFNYIKIFAISFLISFISMPIIIKICHKKKIYDFVDDRKIHNGNISRLGGLGIFLGFIVSYIILIVIDLNLNFNIKYFTIAIFIAFLTGFVDDLKHINAYIKLFLQFLAGVFVVLSGLKIDRLTVVPNLVISFGFFSNIFTVIWVAAFMNAINLLDGLDGLASGVVSISLFFVFILGILSSNISVAFLSISLIAAILGFLVFNFPPAKIFMGDGGAYFLGFMYSVLPLIGVKKASSLIVIAIPVIFLMIPILDMINVTRKRWFNGLKVFSADKNHIHHRLLNIGFSNKGIIFIIYAYTFVLGIFGIIMLYLNPLIDLIIMFLLFILTVLAFITISQAEKKIEYLENQIYNENDSNNNNKLKN